MITEERKAILLEYERLANQVSDLHAHDRGQTAAFRVERLAAGVKLVEFSQLHQVTTFEMTELKRAGRPVCTTKKQAFELMNNFFGQQNDNTKF